ncbi:MAG: SsrA-binding protein SmpB [Candidatus Yonathbacteria bacterium]|nr:SsrA-binding protein SmpB [Candidatus Yonathbacteria bacterium]
MALIENKKARFNYEIIEKYEAGIELLGVEVKSLRAKHGSLEGSHIVVRGGEAFLVGSTIQPYQAGNSKESYDPNRNRRLLLTKKELTLLADYESKKGLTIVPIAVYNKKRKLKIEIAVVRGKKTRDKRESLKKREAERDILRDIKGTR